MTDGRAPAAAELWDVFVSYAREDYVQAKDLHDALLECVTEQGRPPRVYLDISSTGTPLGANWENYLSATLRGTSFFVVLYSQTYFEKQVCQWELNEALSLGLGTGGRVIPLLIDPGAVKQIPFNASKINWIPTTRPHWIDEVRGAVGLRKAEARPLLQFTASVTEAVAGHTLPLVQVAVTMPDGTPAPAIEPVRISAEPDGAGLAGTLTARALDGAAVFSDLVLRTPVDQVTLVATAPGCVDAQSPAFPVRAPEQQPSWDAPGRRVHVVRGRPVFFPDGQSVAAYDEGTVTVCTPTGEIATAVECGQRPRLRARGRSLMAVADWDGRVVLTGLDGAIRVWDVPASADSRYTVPGALAFDGDQLYVGTWRGEVWSLTLDDRPPQRILEYSSGIQVLAVDGDRMLVGGFDGSLVRLTAGRVAVEHEVESLLHALAVVRGYAVVVGEEQVYRLNLADDRLVRVKVPVNSVVSALPTDGLTVVADAEGQVVAFDIELAVSLGFRTVPGARPVDSALGGRLLVLAHPDGSHALVREGRTVYVSPHRLAVSPDGKWVAASDGDKLLVLPPGELVEGAADPAGGEDA